MCESLGCVAQMSDVTDLMNAAKAGDRVAAAELLPLVYGELRKLAAVRMVREDCNHTLQPTALVHEAYLRLIGPTDEVRWQNEGHFFAAAAEAMRRILVDAARRKAALRHAANGSGWNCFPILPSLRKFRKTSSLSTKPWFDWRSSTP